MPSSLLRRSLAALLIVASACASGGAGTSTPRSTPPRMRNVGHPVFSSHPSGDTWTEITLMVDADGRPDMSTLRASGNGVVDNQAITEWISHSSFVPGTLGDVPVRAEFKMTIETKSVVQRVH